MKSDTSEQLEEQSSGGLGVSQILISKQKDDVELYFWQESECEYDPQIFYPASTKPEQASCAYELTPEQADFFHACTNLKGFRQLLINGIGAMVRYDGSSDLVEDALALSSKLTPSANVRSISIKTYYFLPRDIFKRMIATRERHDRADPIISTAHYTYEV